MDQIIETLEKIAIYMDDYEGQDLKGFPIEEVREANDNLAVLIDRFRDAKKEIDAMIQAYHTEGESVSHLVEDPTGGETLSDSSATEEDDLQKKELEGAVNELESFERR